jgi:hypothetical protein
VLESGLVEHREVAAVERRLEHFALDLAALEGAGHIVEEAELASFLDSVHKDPFAVVDLDRVDALGAALHEVDHGEGHLDVGDIFADVDAWADGVLEYAVAGEVDHAWDGHALADAHTSDAAGDDVEAVVITHLYLQDQGDAYGDQAVKTEAEDLDLGRGDNPASFHLAVQLHCFHYLVATLFLFHADQPDLFDHHSAILAQCLVDNHFLSSFDYSHFANALVPLPMVVLVMPLFYKSDLKSLRNIFLSHRLGFKILFFSSLTLIYALCYYIILCTHFLYCCCD